MTGWDDLQTKLRAGTMNRRDFMAAATALGISASLVHEAAAQTPKRGGHLIIASEGATANASLDPGRANTNYMAMGCSLLYDGLTWVDEHIQLHPALAESWTTKPGATEWVFKLRKGVVFHNGKPMTPADVVFSINHHRKPESGSALRGAFGAISDVKATGADEVTVTLKEGNADFPYLLADWHIGVVPDGSDFSDGVGTGAFSLESFEVGVRLRAKRNPNDWAAGTRGWVDSVELLAVGDVAARISALLSGSVHLINRIGTHGVPILSKSPQLQVFNTPGAGIYEFAMLCDTPPYDNNDLRLALKFATDRETILKIAQAGFGRIANDQPIPPHDPMYAADLPQRPYDPDQAKFHYKKSGHSGPLVLGTAEIAFPGAVDYAQLYKASAAKAGIDIEIKREANDGYYIDVWKRNSFYATSSSGRPTADLMLSTYLLSTSPPPYNETHFKNARFDQLVLAARSELDVGRRKQMYRELQMIVRDDGGLIVPVFNNFLDAGVKRLNGFVLHPLHDMSNNRAPERVWFADA